MALYSVNAFERATALLAAASVTAGIGLAGYDLAGTTTDRRALMTNANAGRAPAITAPVRPRPALPGSSQALRVEGATEVTCEARGSSFFRCQP